MNNKYFQSTKTGKQIDDAVGKVPELMKSVETIESDIKNLKDAKADKSFVPKKTSDLLDDTTQNTYDAKSTSPQSGQAVAQAIAQLLGSAPENLDTLEELAKALQNDESFANKIINMISGKVDKEEGKGLVEVDAELDETSENPVQNKVVAAIEKKTINIDNLSKEDVDVENMTFEASSVFPLWLPTEEYPNGAPHYVYFKDAKAREKIDKVEETANNASERAGVAVQLASDLQDRYLNLEGKFNNFESDVNDNIKPKLTDLDKDIADLEDRKANVFSMSAKGENININDSADSKFNSLKLYGKSKQNKYSGKNLFNNDTSLIKIISYISSEGGTENFRAGYEIELPPGTYTAKAYFKDGPRTDTSEKLYLYGIIVDENNVVAVANSKLGLLTTNNNGVDVFNTRTFEIQEGQKLKYYDGNNTGDNNGNLNHAKNTLFPILNIQIEKGSTVTEYEPYTGGKPSPSPEYPQEMSSVGEDGSVEVGIRGKNLIPYLYNSNITISGVEVIDNGDGSLTLNGSTASVKYGLVAKASFPKNVPLTLSCKGLLGYEWNELSFQLQNFDASNTKINTTTVTKSDVSKTVTFSDNYSYSNIYICVGGNKEIHTTLFPMVAVGSTATEYEPRKELQSLITSTPNGLPGIPVTSGGNYTDVNGQQWLCDEYDFTTGKKIKWIETYTYNGTINLATYCTTDYGPDYILLNIIPPDYEGRKVGNVLSSHFKYNSREFVPNTIRAYDTGIYISLSPSDIGYVEGDSPNIIKTKTIEYLNSFVSESNPLIIIYSKKDAVIEEIPSDLMNAYSELKTYKPVSNIYTLEGAGIEVDYVADTKAYIDNKFIELQQAIISMGGNV